MITTLEKKFKYDEENQVMSIHGDDEIIVIGSIEELEELLSDKSVVKSRFVSSQR